MASYEVRELQVGDLTLDNVARLNTMLSQLRTTQLQEDIAQVLLSGMQTQGSKVFVAVNPHEQICGVLTLMLEIKMLQGGCIAGHIEDVATHPECTKQGIGGMLTQYAVRYAQEAAVQLGELSINPYKIVLDCGNNLGGFYEQQGFEVAGLFMRKYLR